MSEALDFGAATAALDASEAGVELELLTETGEHYDPPVVVKVLGDLARPVRVARSLYAMQYAAKVPEGGVLSPETQAQAIDDWTVGIAAAATASWNVTSKGEPVPCTRENVLALYRAKPHFVGQIAERRRSLDADFRERGGLALVVDEAPGGDGAASGEREEPAGAPRNGGRKGARRGA